MKQINFKIEKNATEAKTYIEFNSLIEFLKERSNLQMENYKFWFDKFEEFEETEDKDEMNYCQKAEDSSLERSCEIDQLEYAINKQFIEFTKAVNKNGFN